MKHSLLLYLAIPAFVLTLVSCSKDSPDYGDEVIIEGDYRKPSSLADGEKIAFPAWVSEGLSKDFADAVKGRLKETAPSADNAQVIVTDMAGYSGLDALKGRVVVVCDPSKSCLNNSVWRRGISSVWLSSRDAPATVPCGLRRRVWRWTNASTALSPGPTTPS